MKIIKRHKNHSAHSKYYGVFSGKELADIDCLQVSHGGRSDKIEYIKIGDNSNEAFIWFDDMADARAIGKKLISFADEADRRLSLQNATQ